MNLDKFNKAYYYKNDLVKFCSKWGLPTYGTKSELNNYIKLYLSGVNPNNIHAKRIVKRHNKLLAKDISLDTKLINSGFYFNEEARKFFCNYYNVKHFSFNKKMAIIKRKAEINNNYDITIGDLIVELRSNNQIISRSSEKDTYQWNNFVSDFFASQESNKFNNKLKVASILWKHVRDSFVFKKYTSNLIDEYYSEINTYLKKI